MGGRVEAFSEKEPSQKVSLISIHSLKKKKGLQERNLPEPTPHSLLSPWSTLPLMNSKMLRFAYQSGAVPFRGDEGFPPTALNHTKHAAIFCKKSATMSLRFPLSIITLDALAVCLQAK